MTEYPIMDISSVPIGIILRIIGIKKIHTIQKNIV
jgi:hypothetical protein